MSELGNHSSLSGSTGPLSAKQHRFFPLFTQNQRRIFAYIYTLAPNRVDAEDLLQETSITLWEKFDEFQPGTDFTAWACRIAYWKVCNARKKNARSKMTFSQPLVDELADKLQTMQPNLDARHEALATCIEKLPQRDRSLILARYQPDGAVSTLAEQTGRTLQAIYKALTRIRRVLFDCVNREMEAKTP